jgi:hypothetical protein
VGDYYRRVRVQWELLSSSTLITYSRVNAKLHPQYHSKTIDEKLTLNTVTDELFAAYVMIVGAHRDRFGEMIDQLEKNFAVGKKNYPSNLMEAKDYLDKYEEIINNHEARKYKTVRKQDQNPNQISKNEKESDGESIGLSFATVPVCHVCGKKGHLATKCFSKTLFRKRNGTLRRLRTAKRARRNQKKIHRRKTNPQAQKKAQTSPI